MDAHKTWQRSLLWWTGLALIACMLTATAVPVLGASERLSRALSGRSTDVEAARAQLDRLTTGYQQLETEIRASSPRYAALTQPEPLTVAQIQREALDENTVLLEFGLGEKRSWLWAVTTQTVESFELPPRRDIESAARQWYGEVTGRQTRAARTMAAGNSGTAAALGRMLFSGIADKLHGSWSGSGW
jgi:hypothetical protein